MIGLDTNVLVRYLTQDEPDQAAKASRAIESADAGSLFVSVVVLCELIWVLEDAYSLKRADLEKVLERILLTGQFAFDNKDLLWQALVDYQKRKGDFSDHVIGRYARRAGAEHTLTFDRELRGSPTFKLL